MRASIEYDFLGVTDQVFFGQKSERQKFDR